LVKVQSRATAKGEEANLTTYFNAWNRNKQSLTLEMSRPEAREIARRLSQVSDVVIENFSPGSWPTGA
jgi:crotonobetainyl-CoA:carnitine CoA-transferase CaiB-like acyl-CoA transferase